MSAVSLYALNEYVRRVIQLNFSEPVWIDAELAQVNQSKGHWYIELVEKDPNIDQVIARAQGTLWSRRFAKLQRQYKKQMDLEQILVPGATCRLLVEVRFSERFGYSLNILDVDPDFSLGQLAQQRERALRALQEGGYLQVNKKLALPVMPQRIAVLSAENAAGYRDFIDQLHRNNYGFHFETTLFPIAVQGMNVLHDLQGQIKRIQAQADQFDTIVLTRGGGSRLDLLAFDNYDICVLLAELPLPLITGIGHEVDTSLADLVAHTALKTPTAVAEFFLQKALILDSQLQDLRDRIYRVAKQQIQLQQQQLQLTAQQVQIQSEKVLQEQYLRLQQAEQILRLASKQHLQTENLRLEHLAARILLLDPQDTLARGYTMTTDPEGNRLFTKAAAENHEQIITHFKDGQLASRTEKS